MFLTLSSTATLRDFHTNSQTAMTHATPMPPISTTNTPPTLAKPSSFAALELLDVSSCKIKRWHDAGSIALWHRATPDACEAELTLQDPPPRFSFHQRVFRICSLPSSCSLSTAPLMAVRYGESATETLQAQVSITMADMS